jgi:glycosyltransferase involved in cell wall biosynthesis
MNALVVLPTYNEADNIAEVLRRVRRSVPMADILVVDDASPDRTSEIARARAGELGRIDVLSRPGKLGLGSAYRDAFIEGLRRSYAQIARVTRGMPRGNGELQAQARCRTKRRHAGSRDGPRSTRQARFRRLA